jgi:hypothetical protein
MSWTIFLLHAAKMVQPLLESFKTYQKRGFDSRFSTEFDKLDAFEG